jgi:hypothetical protein
MPKTKKQKGGTRATKKRIDRIEKINRIERVHRGNIYETNIPITEEFMKPLFENKQICINKAAQIPHTIVQIHKTPETPLINHIAPFIQKFVRNPSPHFRKNMFRVHFTIPVDACGKRVLFRDINDHPGPGNNEVEKQIMKTCESTMDYPVHTNVPIVIDIAGYTRKKVEACIPWVKVVLLFMYNESQQLCRKGMRIVLLLTPFKRRRDQGYVNGGITTSCNGSQGEILVYREEEWFKVLIHELFHRVGLEWSHTTALNDKSFESYVEYWSERLLVLMKAKGVLEYEECMRLEVEHTNERNSVLSSTELEYGAAYEEYYIIKGRMMGAKGLEKGAAEEAERKIHDLRMTHHNMVFPPLPTTHTTNNIKRV